MPQGLNNNTNTNFSITTKTTTSTHHLLQQQYEMQSTRHSEHISTGADVYVMDQPMQQRNAQMDIRPGETQTELLRRALLEFGLPPELLHEVRSSGHDSNAGARARARADTFVLRNQATQELTEVLFDYTSSGVTHNVAVRSQQFNTAMGPGSRVYRNNATDAEQRNCAICIVM